MPPRSKSSSMPCRRRPRGRSSAARSWSGPGGPRGPNSRPSARLPVRWKIVAGPGVIAEGETSGRAIVLAADLPLGVHRLQLTDASSTTEDVPLISAPERAFGGDFDRCWLLAVQLYSVRSARNWGIGDFTDLARPDRTRRPSRRRRRRPQSAACAVRRSSAAIAAPIRRTAGCFSTRSISMSRRFRNFSLDADDQGCAGAGAGRRRRRLRRRRRSEMARAAHRHSTPSRPMRHRGAGRILKNSAPSAAPLLSRFACFEALRHKFNKPWWEWPEQWRQPDDAKCAALRKGADAAEIEFVEFVQWTADRQLAAASDRAHQLGMKVGLYLDVAVGVQSDGFDAWNEQVAISRHLGVGAPPDPLNTAGQSWGLAGFNAAGPRAEILRALPRDAARLDAACRRDPARPCARAEAALSGAAWLSRRRRRLCADAVRGAAGGDRAGKRRATAAS